MWACPWPWQRAHKGLSWLFTHWRVIFPNKGFFQWGLPWPWEHALGGCIGLYCLPMGTSLALAACLSHRGAVLILATHLCHGCFPKGKVISGEQLLLNF